VVGDVLRGFKRVLVLQVRGDAGRPEGMVSDSRLGVSVARPPLDCAALLSRSSSTIGIVFYGSRLLYHKCILSREEI
jgi:hypothetical protein